MLPDVALTSTAPTNPCCQQPRRQRRIWTTFQRCYRVIHDGLHLCRQPNDGEDWQSDVEGRDTLIVDVWQILDSEIDERSDPFARDHKYLTKSRQHAVEPPWFSRRLLAQG